MRQLKKIELQALFQGYNNYFWRVQYLLSAK